MALVNVKGIGQIGLNKDLSNTELPINAWTDSNNIRFLDGYAGQFLGHQEIIPTPTYQPQHIRSAFASTYRGWVYATATKQFFCYNSAGTPVHVDITHATPRSGHANQWTSTLLSGIPVLNAGDGLPPMAWNGAFASKFVDLTNWQSGYSCKAIRSFKNFLIALNITKSGVAYPYMVKWSHPASPGTLPSSWDQTDATKLAGELDIADGYDQVVDGMILRDSFMIYKENSIWRMDYIGGNQIFKLTKVTGKSGAMNLNCITEINGNHFVLTNNDIIVHDGVNAQSILDKMTRRWLFTKIDSNNYSQCFTFANPFYNEVFICYPQNGSSYCDKAIVYNYVDKTVSMRDLPSITHADCGPIDLSGTANNWDSDSATWENDYTFWDQDLFMTASLRAVMSASNNKLYVIDQNASFDGVLPAAYLERKGLHFGSPEKIKLIKGIRPRIKGNTGDIVNVYVAATNDPNDSPVYGAPMQHTIGTTIANDCLVAGRYIAIKFETGNGYGWRLDSFDIDVDTQGYW